MNSHYIQKINKMKYLYIIFSLILLMSCGQKSDTIDYKTMGQNYFTTKLEQGKNNNRYKNIKKMVVVGFDTLCDYTPKYQEQIKYIKFYSDFDLEMEYLRRLEDIEKQYITLGLGNSPEFTRQLNKCKTLNDSAKRWLGRINKIDSTTILGKVMNYKCKTYLEDGSVRNDEYMLIYNNKGEIDYNYNLIFNY